ncbi:hypothetical protein L3X38_039458 [Prunus dulcis]|uniref:ARM repeat superfamily protein n=1 Tax=Prunus dulcis TaxID=3755 RepID=A0AAD4YSG7_PRUDU|nr:hypothetical protein L3X38_039458 [Prunus dulcis]
MLSYQHPELQDVFAQHDVVRLLIGHLAFETVEVHSSKTHSNDNANANEDPATREKMKAMAAKALCRLAEGTQPFAVASQNQHHYIVSITENVENSDFQVFCIKAIGNLAKTFGSRETRMINRLVQLLNGSEYDVTEEACIALTKFSCTDNYFHIDHSKAIISAGALNMRWFSSATLHCMYWTAKSLPRLRCLLRLQMEELAQAGVLPMLEWETEQSYMSKDETVLTLLQGAKSRLNLHQSKASRGVH